MRYYPYEEFRKDLVQLCQKITDDFDAIVAIARGGMTIAHMMGEYFDIRNVFTINAIGYNEDTKLDTITISSIPDLTNASKILLVDDIVDSGDTIQKVCEVLQKKYPNLKIKTAAIFYKEGAKVKPDYYIHQTDEWIDFFWTRDVDDTYDR